MADRDPARPLEEDKPHGPGLKDWPVTPADHYGHGWLAAREARDAALAALVTQAVSTETIVRDRAGEKRLGHNPSWVKAAQLAAILKGEG